MMETHPLSSFIAKIFDSTHATVKKQCNAKGKTMHGQVRTEQLY